jgi:hypothetical protein
MDAAKLRCLFKSWGHSREEDADGLTVYRPAEFKFPMSRGRDGIELHPDGTFVRLEPGPDDRRRRVSGSWTFAGDAAQTEAMQTSVESESPRRMTIVQCDPDVLKVRWD